MRASDALGLATLALSPYLLAVLGMAGFEGRLIFRTDHAFRMACPAVSGVRHLALDVAPDVRLAGVLHPADGLADGPPLLLFAGNAWNAATLAALIARLAPERDVAAFHYRGYAPSTGYPSAAAILDDALAVHDHVAHIVGRPITAVGVSLGTGPACRLASRRALSGLVLVTPFDSLTAVAGDRFPWAPVHLLMRNRMEAAADLALCGTPTGVIAAEHDLVVRPARTDRLRDSARNLVYDHVLEGAGHSDFFTQTRFAQALRDALREVETAPAAIARPETVKSIPTVPASVPAAPA